METTDTRKAVRFLFEETPSFLVTKTRFNQLEAFPELRVVQAFAQQLRSNRSVYRPLRLPVTFRHSLLGGIIGVLSRLHIQKYDNELHVTGRIEPTNLLVQISEEDYAALVKDGKDEVKLYPSLTLFSMQNSVVPIELGLTQRPRIESMCALTVRVQQP